MMRRRSGQILVVVFWMLGIVSLTVGAVVMRSGHEARLSRFPLETIQREAIAEAAVQQAIALLKRDEDAAVDHLGESWATGEEAGEAVLDNIPVGPGFFTAALIDEGRKLHLNTSTADALKRLIEAVNVAGVNAQQIAEAIIDWRTATDPETGVCAGQNPACHNGPLASVDELRLVPGMTPELFDALAPYVTIYGEPLPNVNTSDPWVLRAWGLTDAQVDEIVTRRQTQPLNAYPELGVQSTAFTVSVEAWFAASSLRTRLHAVIDRDGNILSWLPQ